MEVKSKPGEDGSIDQRRMSCVSRGSPRQYNDYDMCRIADRLNLVGHILKKRQGRYLKRR